jgi:hypothetical protein
MAIIALWGYARSGKDTVAKMIQDKQPEKNWQIKKFSGKLKEMASALTDYSVEHFENQDFKEKGIISIDRKQFTVREFLQFLGTECVRDILGEDVWGNALFKDYDDSQNWIITDCRFPNEADRVDSKNGYIIEVDRGIEPVNAHSSETAMKYYNFDYTILNWGDLKNLDYIVDLLLEKL